MIVHIFMPNSILMILSLAALIFFLKNKHWKTNGTGDLSHLKSYFLSH